ncbi:hypothetical protein QLQ12_09925 [Actinoplanes sp. NEAU-A12]|uniref:DUF937 domain-containing protein n=1 Tax=Actinoplanes sandaracinus TaxID=3045177 RepID=A0ABT6WGS6_9ACTN|nr:hypothetical protein [Actinoplanes sandaracinus]MDI6098917.1 hypothetical protein [Actinoplanes sandaracinus]
MTTTTAAPGAVTSLLGQQGQGGSTPAGQVDAQGIFDSILKNLPDIIRVVQGVAAGQSAGPQGFQQQQVDPQGLFDSILKQLPTIIRVVQGVVAGQSAGPQGYQPQGYQPYQQQGYQPQGYQQGYQPQDAQQQQLDPQFLQFILPALPALIGAVTQLVRPQQAGPQQQMFGPQMFGQQGQQGQQLDPQGLFDSILKQLPTIIRVVQGVVTGQSAGPQGFPSTPQSQFPTNPFPWSSGWTGWPFQPRPTMQMTN